MPNENVENQRSQTPAPVTSAFTVKIMIDDKHFATLYTNQVDEEDALQRAMDYVRNEVGHATFTFIGI
jgi:hypothetical protein